MKKICRLISSCCHDIYYYVTGNRKLRMSSSNFPYLLSVDALFKKEESSKVSTASSKTCSCFCNVTNSINLFDKFHRFRTPLDLALKGRTLATLMQKLHKVCDSGIARAFSGGQICPCTWRAKMRTKMRKLRGKIRKNNKNFRKNEESGTVAHPGL